MSSLVSRNCPAPDCRRRPGFVAAVLAGALAATAATASAAADPVPTAAPAAVAVPADLVLYRIVGDLLVGATADGRIVTYDIRTPATPQKRSERDAGGSIVDLRVVDGVVFAVVAQHRVEAYTVTAEGQLAPYRPGATAVAGMPSTPAADRLPVAATAASLDRGSREAGTVIGRIVSSRLGTVLLELDAGASLKPGDLLLVRSQQLQQRVDLLAADRGQVASNAPVAVIEVRQVEGRRAVADLARGDAAHPGDTVEPTTKAQRSPLFAQRAPYRQWVRLILRPFLNFGEADVATVTEVAGGWNWDRLHLQARLAPVGLSVPHSVRLVNAQFIAGYDAEVAEFGIGTGWFYNTHYAWTCEGAPTTDFREQPCSRSVPTLLQHLRLGATDGLHLRLTNTVAIERGQFVETAFEGNVDLPLSRELNLYGAGGGGTGETFAWGEAGVRIYARGNGGGGTLVLTTGVGGSMLETSERFGGSDSSIPGCIGSNCDSFTGGSTRLGGLHLTLGGEYRF